MSFLPLPFVLSDSIASIPGTMNFCQKSLGIDIKFAKISIPIGMQLNMDGTAFYVSLVSMMLAKNAGIQIGPVFYISFFIALFLISLTGLGIIAMPSIYLAFGIPRI